MGLAAGKVGTRSRMLTRWLQSPLRWRIRARDFGEEALHLYLAGWCGMDQAGGQAFFSIT